jgi:hypothetical protein
MRNDRCLADTLATTGDRSRPGPEPAGGVGEKALLLWCRLPILYLARGQVDQSDGP